MENTYSADTTASQPETKAPRAKLEDIMAAMDVVDTLRHREGMVERELDADSRRERLLQRLRDMYTEQGLDVPDHILEEGIKALDEDRFKYYPTKKNFSTLLAHIYVSRKKWGIPLAVVLLAISVLYGGNYFLNERPQQLAIAALPTSLQQTYTEIKALAKQPVIAEQAQELQSSAAAALQNNKPVVAQSLLDQMEGMLAQLRVNYKIRIVSRPGEQSGVWRIPDVNTNARNYYLIVEAIDARNKVLTLPVMSEESGKRSNVDKWGIRVDMRTFNAVAADKRDDGIIQGNIVGEKPAGYLLPRYNIAIKDGGTITQW
ncbi:DUF6384 family protein [Neptunomonas qingdaonensis]|uniref:Uncharacterized protein n=1 Tax=Neptunomonas qingdaonensis TaxID=1045558 RepID=A0A1I2Q1Z9_9GAMM|nr:DUF6384 family protein [Neptunomonas qingdaonensis]SFG19661.1 hypothetical protein SAMN05216175_10479 [Neptunomonas qingdaonensis]